MTSYNAVINNSKTCNNSCYENHFIIHAKSIIYPAMNKWLSDVKDGV